MNEQVALNEFLPPDSYEPPNGPEPIRQRKTRSDRGVPRAPKMETDIVAADLPTPPGAITKQQAAQLIRLAEIMCATSEQQTEAQRQHAQALANYFEYVESLSSK